MAWIQYRWEVSKIYEQKNEKKAVLGLSAFKYLRDYCEKRICVIKPREVS